MIVKVVLNQVFVFFLDMMAPYPTNYLLCLNTWSSLGEKYTFPVESLTVSDISYSIDLLSI